MVAKARKMLPPQENPIVRTHPDSGRQCLFVNPLMTTHIADVSDKESRALLDFLFEHITQPEYQVRFKWRPHSIAMWDNRCTIHRGVFDFGDAHRLMYRISLDDDQRPYH